MICALREGMKAAGLYYSQLIIWVKNIDRLGTEGLQPAARTHRVRVVWDA